MTSCRFKVPAEAAPVCASQKYACMLAACSAKMAPQRGKRPASLQREQRQCREPGSSCRQHRTSQGTQQRHARVSLWWSKQVPQTSILTRDRLPLMPHTSHKQYCASMASCSTSMPLPSLAWMRSHSWVQSLWSANSYASRVSWNKLALPSYIDLKTICCGTKACCSGRRDSLKHE